MRRGSTKYRVYNVKGRERYWQGSFWREEGAVRRLIDASLSADKAWITDSSQRDVTERLVALFPRLKVRLAEVTLSVNQGVRIGY